MVRIRKNAELLTTAERDRFVKAFVQLNDQGAGRFADFRNMHTDVSSPQAHGAPGFLPGKINAPHRWFQRSAVAFYEQRISILSDPLASEEK